MFTKLQLVMLGVVVLQGAGLSAMDKGKSPRNPLSCSQEARRTDSGELMVKIAAIKRPLEISKEEKMDVHYPWPGGNPEIYWYPTANVTDRMKPWFPHSH
jgi:hypothetical protein